MNAWVMLLGWVKLLVMVRSAPWAKMLLRSELAPGQGQEAEDLWVLYREAAGERS